MYMTPYLALIVFDIKEPICRMATFTNCYLIYLQLPLMG